ncbi:MAG: hypothetical protein IK990_11525 [Ruminiclostridium sp.]|nr:hypothetical protein [Ruminiclostridium sp.]MBP3856226.1 hypothetical protein [Ruminiclostridium sp.]
MSKEIKKETQDVKLSLDELYNVAGGRELSEEEKKRQEMMENEMKSYLSGETRQTALNSGLIEPSKL